MCVLIYLLCRIDGDPIELKFREWERIPETQKALFQDIRAYKEFAESTDKALEHISVTLSSIFSMST